MVLPLPFWCYPDTSGQYGRYVGTTDFEVMMNALREIEPQYYEKAKSFFKGKTLYNYNMLIAKSSVFDCYCEFMFSVLEKIEAHFESIEIFRSDRYLGYIGELLTSLYFHVNISKLKIAHAQKEWLV